MRFALTITKEVNGLTCTSTENTDNPDDIIRMVKAASGKETVLDVFRHMLDDIRLGPHRCHDGSIAWGPTIRFYWAIFFPPRVPMAGIGRALTWRENRKL